MVKQGSKSFIGYAPEVAWGTGVYPGTKFVPFLNESFIREPEYMDDESIRNSTARFYQEEGTVGAGGGLQGNVYPEDMDTILKHMFGVNTPSAPVEAGVYDHVMTLGDLSVLKGLTFEIYKDGTTFGYAGSRCSEVTFTSSINAFLNFNSTWLSKNEELDPSGKSASPTYTAVKPFKWHQGTFKIDTVEAELLDLNFTINHNLKDDKFAHNGQERVDIPHNGLRDVTGTFRMEFDDTTQYAKFVSGAEVALQIVYLTTSLIGTISYYTLTFDFPVVKFNGNTPNVESHEIMEHDIPFRALENIGVGHEVTCTLRNTQATI